MPPEISEWRLREARNSHTMHLTDGGIQQLPLLEVQLPHNIMQHEHLPDAELDINCLHTKDITAYNLQMFTSS